MVVIAWWWLYQKPLTEQHKKHSSPNVVSNQLGEQAAVQTKSIVEKPQPVKADKQEVVVTMTSHSSDADKQDSVLSYLEVYRMNRQFETCQNIIYRLVEEDAFDPVASFEIKIKNLQNLHPDWPTPSQIEAIQKHASLCDKLYAKILSVDLPEVVKNEDIKLASMYELKQRFEQYLSTFQPKTPKEHAIADVLGLIVIWREHFNRVLEVSKGTETASQEQIEAIRDQIETLTEQRRIISNQLQQNEDTELRVELIDVALEIENLKDQIVALKVVNPEERRQAIAAFEVVNDLLFAELKTKDPDVFYEAQRALELNQHNVRQFGFSPYKNHGQSNLKEPFVEFVSPGEVIKNILGIRDNEIFNLVINHATQLYHCELGADCSPEGEWNLFYCHLGYDNLSDAACDYGLPIFLKDHYLNQNQWQDIQYVLDILRGLYAN